MPQQTLIQEWSYLLITYVKNEADETVSSLVQDCLRDDPLAQAWGQDSLIILCNAWNVSLMPVQKDKACKSTQKQLTPKPSDECVFVNVLV